MQSLVLCLTTFAFFAITLLWSQCCSGDEIEATAPCETTIKSLLIKPTETNHTGRERSSATDLIDQLVFADRNFLAQVSKTKTQKSENSFVKPVSTKPKVEAALPQIAAITIRHHFGEDQNEEYKNLSLDELADRFVVKEQFKKDAGLFITLIKDGNTRACWGSINANHKDLVRATVYTTEDALRKDYRYTPVKKNEINQLIPQVTVVKRIVPINSMKTMQPLKQGLMVRAGGKGAVLLPGEASDPHYQLVKCKLKAGIPSSQPCQLYKIEADVYR